MRAITYDRFGPAQNVVTLKRPPTPPPKPGEVLVRLYASGMNPSDIRARAGGRPGVTEPPFPKVIPHGAGVGLFVVKGWARLGHR